MVDPRIYRSGLAVVAVALIVFGFSLENQQGGLGTTLAPAAFNGNGAYSAMVSLAKAHPDRAPGSPDDDAIAQHVASVFRSYHAYAVSTNFATVQTAVGSRTIETVTAARTGLEPGTIVVLAHRDYADSPGEADLSGTTVLLELARVLAGETENRSLMLVSTSGSVGAAGASEVARSLAGSPVDAVIVLGDLASTHVTQPVISPWSTGGALAPPLLRNTLAGPVSSQGGLSAGGTGIGGQLAHLAFPLTVTEQGPFGALGIPSVLLSVSGSRAPVPGKPVSEARIGGLGRAVLEAVNSLDAGQPVPAVASYLLLDGKVVPAWAVRLLVLALILPVLIATVDALARTRRRGHSLLRWLLWVLAGAVPFLAALALIVLARLVGWLGAVPPGPVGDGGVPLHAGGIALLVLVAIVLVASFVALRPYCIRLAAAIGDRERERGPQSPAGDAAAVALLVVMCLTTLVIWVLSPFAAALVVPALHLWLWLAHSGVRSRRVVLAVFAVIGILPPVLVVYYYAHSLGLSPVDIVWNGVLLLASGQVGALAALYWSVLLGCTASALLIMLRSSRERHVEEPAVSVRGPASYAGPGSLGGTESALRR